MGTFIQDFGAGGIRTPDIWHLFKVVVQNNLLFGSENWVMNPRIGRTLGGFHHRVAHHLAGMKPKRYTEGRWEYPPMDAEMAAVVLEEVETYTLRLQNTISQYIKNLPIMEIRIMAEWRTVAQVTCWWWEQGNIYLGL